MFGRRDAPLLRDAPVPRVRVACDLSAFCALGRRSFRPGPSPSLMLRFLRTSRPCRGFGPSVEMNQDLRVTSLLAPPPRRFSSWALTT